jgi:hypothetical protein
MPFEDAEFESPSVVPQVPTLFELVKPTVNRLARFCNRQAGAVSLAHDRNCMLSYSPGGSTCRSSRCAARPSRRPVGWDSEPLRPRCAPRNRAERLSYELPRIVSRRLRNATAHFPQFAQSHTQFALNCFTSVHATIGRLRQQAAAASSCFPRSSSAWPRCQVGCMRRIRSQFDRLAELQTPSLTGQMNTRKNSRR